MRYLGEFELMVTAWVLDGGLRHFVVAACVVMVLAPVVRGMLLPGGCLAVAASVALVLCGAAGWELLQSGFAAEDACRDFRDSLCGALFGGAVASACGMVGLVAEALLLTGGRGRR